MAWLTTNILPHIGAIASFGLGLMLDLTILFPGLEQNSIYKAVNSVFTFLKGPKA